MPAPPAPETVERHWRRDALVVAVITALTVVYFYPLLLGRTNSILGPYGSYVYPWASIPNTYGLQQPQTDYAELSYPWLVATDDALDEGTIPLWSADVYGGGYDLYANGSSALLYPPRLLALLVTSPVRAHDLFLVFHLWASGLAMYALARQLALGRWAGTFAAVAWMFATWNTGWMQLEVVTPMALFLPATVAAVHRAMTRRSARSVLVAGVVCALAASSGHLLLLGVTLLVAAGYAGALGAGSVIRSIRAEHTDRSVDHTDRSVDQTARSGWQGPRHLHRSVGIELATVAGRLGLLGVVAGGLAAVVLLPTALALRDGQRVPFSYAELKDQFLAEPYMLKRLVWPQSVPIDADDMQYLGFVGWATALFGAVGLCSRRRAGAWLARVLVVVVPLVMIGTPLTWLAWRLIPAMDVFRPYTRLIVFASFGLVVAAAIGVQVVVELVQRWRPDVNAQLVLHAALAVVVLATAGHLMYLGRRSNPPFVPHEARYALPPTPLTEFVRADGNPNGWPSRTIPLLLRRAEDQQLIGVTLYANTGDVVGLDTTGGYDSNLDPRTMTVLRVLNGADPNDPDLGTLPAAFLAVYESWSTRFELLARLGVTHIVTVPEPPGTEVLRSETWAALGATKVYEGPDGIVYRVPAAVAGPHLVGADEVVNTEQQALERFVDPSFDAASTVVVEGDQLARVGVAPPFVSGCAGQPGGQGEVTQAVRGINTVTIDVQANCESWLVVPDAWAEGWTARINGQEVPVIRVNYSQRAMRLDAGTATIEMRYRPPGFVAGAMLSGLTAVAVIAGLVVLTVQGRRERNRSARRRLELEHQLVTEQVG